MEFTILSAADLRAFWIAQIQEHGPMSCDEILAALRRQKLRPVGDARKSWIRNIHSAATGSRNLVKVAPGVFGLGPT